MISNQMIDWLICITFSVLNKPRPILLFTKEPIIDQSFWNDLPTQKKRVQTADVEFFYHVKPEKTKSVAAPTLWFWSWVGFSI